jgi:hypothetical protein
MYAEPIEGEGNLQEPFEGDGVTDDAASTGTNLEDTVREGASCSGSSTATFGEGISRSVLIFERLTRVFLSWSLSLSFCAVTPSPLGWRLYFQRLCL